MPDGDIVHGQPSGYYREPYERGCEGKLSPQELAWDLMGALLKDLKYKGDQPIAALREMVEYLAQVINRGEKDWVTINQTLESIKDCHTFPNYYVGEIVLRAIKKKQHSLYFQNMQLQVEKLNQIFTQCEPSQKWKYITQEYPELDDIVDQTCEWENLSPNEMQSRLIRLYQTYVAEWKMVESRLAPEILDPLMSS